MRSALAAGLSALLMAAAAHATPSPRALRPPRGLSVGSPTQGKLAGGVELEADEAVRLRRTRSVMRARWGLPELVGMLGRAARRVESRHPGSSLLVGDLSKKRGGEIPGHHSHESGRDADLGFYFVDSAGKPVLQSDFLQVGWDGRATRSRSLVFDDACNWALVQALLSDPQARVQHIFVADPIRQRLLLHARRVGAYLPLRHRAAIAMKQPSHGLPHDDHFHVRIACPRGQGEVCEAEPDLRRSTAPKRRKRAPWPRVLVRWQTFVR